MTPQEMWNAYKKINPSIGDAIDAWAFGVEADLLADLVLKGEKSATASAYDLYALEAEPLPVKIRLSALSKLQRFLFSLSIKFLLTMPLRKARETNL